MLRGLEALSERRDLVGYSTANIEFHAEIARISCHGTADRLLVSLRSQTVAFQFRPIFEPGRANEIDQEHRLVVDAIAAGDGEAAMRLRPNESRLGTQFGEALDHRRALEGRLHRPLRRSITDGNRQSMLLQLLVAPPRGRAAYVNGFRC